MARVEHEVMRGREGLEEYYERLYAAWKSVRVFDSGGVGMKCSRLS